MQAAPAIELSVQRFGAWNGLLMALGAAAMASCGTWFAERSEDLPVWSAGLIAATLLTAWVGIGLSIRRRPVRLRWDSQRWYLTEPKRQPQEIGPMQVQVMIDSGAVMLLKFVPDSGSNPLSVRWLPVQRRGVEAQWHALRCAVYSPRVERDQSMGHRPRPP